MKKSIYSEKHTKLCELLIEGRKEAGLTQQELAAAIGIYLILDSKTGQQYVGSANGKDGIWQRWSEYAANYTGGNKELVALIKSDPHYYRHFRYSVLQTLPSNITQREIVAIENLYKQKLGSKAHGLNAN